MAINPAKLRPIDLTRLLNSTALGAVLSDRQLRRHREMAGFNISDDGGHSVNLVKYTAWLRDLFHRRVVTSPMDYEAMKEAARARNLMKSISGRDIAPLPEVIDPERKKMCERNFRSFCEKYFPETFDLPWSEDHLKVIAKIEQAVLYGGLFAMAMPRGAGKALALDTPLVTPNGWTTMEKVKVGDTLFDERGRQCRVLAKSPVFSDHKCFRVAFNDGEEIVCDAGHLWHIEDIFGRKNPYVRTTEWMSSRYKVGKRRYHESRFRIPMQKPLQIQSSELPIEPYSLGIWLGDGTCSCSNVTLHEDDALEIAHLIRQTVGIENLEFCNRECKGKAVAGTMTKARHKNRDKSKTFQARLRKLNLLNNKHIPPVYLRADVCDRLDLLQGIMDTDGYVDKGGHCEICIKYPQFADGFGELLSSLGIKWGMGEKTVMLDGKEHGPYYRFYFNGYRDQEFFRLLRKLERLRKRPPRKMTEQGVFSHTPCDIRTIVSIEETPSVPVQCVTVDSPSHLYLAGRKMVPTHNSSVAEAACLWAMFYGHRDFVALISATETAALEMLESIKTELESNELLLEDFPEAVYPIHKLDGISNKCAGQLFDGKRTRIKWTSKEIVLPTIKGSFASGAIIRVAGITGRIRGMKFKRPDKATPVRPSLVIIDDPQTSESANSLEQTKKRVRVLAGDVLGLAGPGEKISGIMPCTVIRMGDMADQILDVKTHPEWNGERTKMVYEFPVNEKLWEKYAEIRADSLRQHGDIRDATAFYREHREEMDEGARVSWDERFNHDEVSAIQHAMNLKFQDEGAFWAEYQNEPKPEDLGEDRIMTASEITQKLNGMKRGEVPVGCVYLTMFIDIQKELLYWLIAAWEEDFTGYVLDYGAYPEQLRRYFHLHEARPTLQDAAPGAGLEGTIYNGLEKVCATYLNKEWRRDDGAMMKIERCLVDANWGQSTDVVYQFCRQNTHSAVLLPSHGRYVGAASRPFSDYRRQPGDRIGHNWMIPNVRGKRAVRHALFDANYWKSFIHARLAVSMGDKGCLSLYGRDSSLHTLLAEHLTSEYRIKTEGRGRKVDEWKIRPEASDNHWLDGIVGAAVAASILGATLPGTGESGKPLKQRRYVDLNNVQKKIYLSGERKLLNPPRQRKRLN